MSYNPNPEKPLTARQRLLIVAVCWAVAIPIFVIAWDPWWAVILVVSAIGVWLSWDYAKKGGMADQIEGAARAAGRMVDGLSGEDRPDGGRPTADGRRRNA